LLVPLRSKPSRFFRLFNVDHVPEVVMKVTILTWYKFPHKAAADKSWRAFIPWLLYGRGRTC
jgi:hypothetical protein